MSSLFFLSYLTVCSPYQTLNLWWPSISSRRCVDLEQSSAAYHICSVTSRLLLSLADILLQTLLLVITVVVPAKWHCHLWTRYSLLLTYLICHHTLITQMTGPGLKQRVWKMHINVPWLPQSILLLLFNWEFWLSISPDYFMLRMRTAMNGNLLFVNYMYLL